MNAAFYVHKYCRLYNSPQTLPLIIACYYLPCCSCGIHRTRKSFPPEASTWPSLADSHLEDRISLRIIVRDLLYTLLSPLQRYGTRRPA